MLKYLFAKADIKSPSGPWLDVPHDAQVFTYHQKHAGRALLFGLLLASIAEAVVVHTLLLAWNYWIAWTATLATLWFGLQVIAQIRAMGLRPMTIHLGTLRLRNGAFDLADVPLSRVASIEKSMKDVQPESDQLSPLNVGFPASHNVVIRLRESMEARILNRKQRHFQTALLAIDEAENFLAVVRKHMVESGK